MLSLENLNEAQRAAVMHGEGPLLVLAGPGSGKTFTITQRILYLIEVQQVPPEEILVITFTRQAAFSMERRFLEQTSRIYPVNFGTFHSVFYQILRKSNPARTRQILRENQKKNLMLSILKQYDIGEQKQACDVMQNEVKELLSAISYYKNTGSWEQTLLKVPVERRTQFKVLYDTYMQTARQQGAIDFDDMVYECEQALRENSQLKQLWSNRFSHILMDEFQDINPMQYQVVRMLTRGPYNLFAVGDDDQAIYGFRGSDTACMQRFLQDYQARMVLLNTNYRSVPSIVSASLQVIGENTQRLGKELHSYKGPEEVRESGGVHLRAFVGAEEQYGYLTEMLQDKSPEDTCAVLFRTNMQLQCLAVRLNRRGISYEMKEQAASIYEHFVVKDIMTYLRLGAGERNRELYLQIINKPYRRISREALETKTDRAFSVLERQLDYLKQCSLYLGVQYICKVIGYERFLEAECRQQHREPECLEEWKQITEWVKEEARNYENVEEWLCVQKAYQESMSACLKRKANEEHNSETPVQLMTVHASKGLEFDTVYIPDCNEKVYPHGSMPDKEQCEEERRIFYVAMTRAKKNLELLYLTGTKERPRLPSRFLNPLLKGK